MLARPMDNGSSRPLGIGLVGVGRHGSRYLQHLLRDLPDLTLTALCRRHGSGPYQGTNIPVYNDYRAMIADSRVDAVVIVTPPSLCRSICLCAVEVRKPVLIEKPLALNGREAREMVEAANRHHVMLMTAQTMRFDPTIQLLREQLPTIGPLHSAILTSHVETKANLLTGPDGPVAVGALLELGVHMLDLVRFLTGEEICDVQCTMKPEPGPETHVQAQIRTTGGILCALDVARAEVQRVGTAEWNGTKGRLSADWVSGKLTKIDCDGRAHTWALEPRPTILATLQAFVGAIRTGTMPPITGLDGCLAVEAADACYRSASQDGAVVRCEVAAGA
jgi:predicted dehydrogenase